MPAKRVVRHEPSQSRKPESELRHWSTYRSTSEYWVDYQGRVPLAMLAALGRAMRERGLTFPEAYRLLHDAGAIIDVEEDPAL